MVKNKDQCVVILLETRPPAILSCGSPAGVSKVADFVTLALADGGSQSEVLVTGRPQETGGELLRFGISSVIGVV